MEPDDEVTIRTADESDAAGIAQVHVRSWQEAYTGIVPDAYLAGLDPAARTLAWQDGLRRGPGDGVHTWVATLGGRVVGFVSVGPARDEDAGHADREIYSIYLEPEQWGQGVARDLLRTVVAETGDRTPIRLWVLAGAERARHFYRRHGFSPDGVEKYEDVGGAELLQVRYLRG
jgi:GNAT superfamily N-acetyltransferase